MRLSLTFMVACGLISMQKDWGQIFQENPKYVTFLHALECLACLSSAPLQRQQSATLANVNLRNGVR